MSVTSARDDLREIGRLLKRGVATPDDPPPVHSSRPRWVALAIAGVLLVAAVWLVAFSPVLAVSTVQVKGTHRLNVQAVLDKAHVRSGTPLIRVPRGAIAHRVEELPDVLSASVSISFPSTVVITVRERVASGVLEKSATSWVLVDDYGRQFSTVAAKPAGLPVLAPAPNVSSDAATLAAMAKVAVSVPADVRATLTQVTATGPGDVNLVLADGRQIVWGGSVRNADKARILPALLARPGKIFNVTDPDLPYTRAG